MQENHQVHAWEDDGGAVPETRRPFTFTRDQLDELDEAIARAVAPIPVVAPSREDAMAIATTQADRVALLTSQLHEADRR